MRPCDNDELDLVGGGGTGDAPGRREFDDFLFWFQRPWITWPNETDPFALRPPPAPEPAFGLNEPGDGPGRARRPADDA